MKKVKIVFLFISLFIVLNLLIACGGKKSVELTMENYEDYLDVNVTTSNYHHSINVNVKSRNSDYIFENCEIEMMLKLYGYEYEFESNTIRLEKGFKGFYPKESIVIKVERNGNGNFSRNYDNAKESDSAGKAYASLSISSYNILSVKGKVTKNQLS